MFKTVFCFDKFLLIENIFGEYIRMRGSGKVTIRGWEDIEIIKNANVW